jgi:hypothetical protein
MRRCAVRLMGRNEDEHALRDAVLLTAAGDDPGPAGKVFLAMQKVSGRTGWISTPFVKELAELWPSWDEQPCEIAGRC